MNKIVSLSIFLFFISYYSYAETITSIANGDWTDPHVWSSGSVPGPYDTIYVYTKIAVNTDILLDHNYLNVTLHGRLCGEHNLTVANHSFMDNYGNVLLNAIYITGDTAINHPSGVVILTTVMIISGFNGYYYNDSGYENIGREFTCDAPLPDFNVDKKNICQHDCVNYTDLSTNEPSSWKWTFEGGTPGSSTLQNPQSICYADTGTFMVKLIAANTAGADTIIKQLYIRVLPGVEKRNYIVSTNTILCPKDTLNLEMNNASGLTYMWNNGSSDSVYTISTPGIYWADVINKYNCRYRDSMVIKSQTIPVVDLGLDGFFCEGHAIVLNAYFNDASYHWQDGSSNPQLTVTKAGTYWVHVSDYCGNTSDTVSFINPVIFIPNLITPNGDSKNDSLVIETNIPNLSLEIYNRWGDRIFSDAQYKNEWNADNINDGVYYYYVANKKVCGIERKGWIEILR